MICTCVLCYDVFTVEISLAYIYTWAVNVSPLTCNKMVESARRVLNRCLPDVYIYTDHRKRDQCGR